MRVVVLTYVVLYVLFVTGGIVMFVVSLPVLGVSGRSEGRSPGVKAMTPTPMRASTRTVTMIVAVLLMFFD